MFQFKYLITFCFLVFGVLQIAKADDVVINDEYATYEEVKDLPNHPEKYLIEVRPKDLVEKDGSIPGSINIPFNELEDALKMSDDDFLQKYAAQKPSKEAVVIFSCLGGKYAEMGAELAKKHGWKSAKPYLGSWMEWSKREGLQ